jgi:hypothetical protein
VFRYPSLRHRLEANSKEIRCHEHDPAQAWTEKPCRVWTGCLNGDGYGSITIRSRYRYKFGKYKGYGIPKRYHAHRVSLAEHHGIPLSALNKACHWCDNRPCIEPTHLRSTTNYQNVRDRVKRGRSRNGHTGPLPENEHLYKAAA